MECPRCNQELSNDEVKSMWAKFCASQKSKARAEASVANGRKGGRPFRLKDAGDGNIFNVAGYVQECMRKVGKTDAEWKTFNDQLWACKDYTNAVSLCTSMIERLNGERGLRPPASK